MKLISFISFTIGLLNPCSAALYAFSITVDARYGRDEEGCRNGTSSCRTIAFAFKPPRQNWTQYVLLAGTYTVEGDVDPFCFTDLYGMSIHGPAGNAETIINCTVPDRGLSFVNVQGVNISDVSFVGCGRNVCPACSGTYCPQSEKLRAGLYIHTCSDVTMSNVTVHNSSNAIGAVFRDTLGTNNVTDCAFLYNGVTQHPSTSSSPSGRGGGGLSVMLGYCTSDCSSNSTYNIYSSRFKANMGGGLAHVGHLPLFQYEAGVRARGGGLSLIFGGNASNNAVIVRGCLLSDNIDSGGMSVDILDNSAGNVVQVQLSKFIHNGGENVVGGGLAVRYITSIMGNRVVVDQSNFINNHALTGGGLAILTAAHGGHVQQMPAPLQLVSSMFNYNRAQLGSAMYALSISSSVEGVAPTILMEGTNVIMGNMQNINLTPTQPYIAGMGAVYTSGVPININGNVDFVKNGRSALAILGTSVDLCMCNATFDSNNNTARGGAIIILNGGWINICNSTFVNFTQNIADVDGGAIYNYYNQIIHSGCFVRYTDPTILPSKWKSHFLFSKNHATYGGNSIHSSSLLPCSFVSSNITETFCWDEELWNYSGYPCQHEIASDASNVIVNMSSAGLTTAYQGQVILLPIQVTDARGNDVINKTTFHATVSNSSIAFLRKDISNVAYGLVQVFANGTGNITLELDEVGIIPGWHVAVSINVKDCPPGLVLNQSSGSCGCSMDDFGSTIICLSIDSDSIQALVQKNNWMGLSPGYGTLVTAACPPGYCTGSSFASITEGYIQLPVDIDKLNDHICADGRTGVLCGECKPNYKPAINSLNYQCVLCGEDVSMTNHWLLYIGLVIVPAIVIFIFSALIGNYVIAGPASAMILFSQLVASTFDLTASGAIDVNDIFSSSGLYLVKGYTLLYGLLNLNGLVMVADPICISWSLDTMELILLKYVISITPLLATMSFFIAYYMATTFFTQCKKRCTACFTAHRHPIKVFAVYLLLTYNKICIITSEVLDLTSLKDRKGQRVGGFRSFFAGQYEISDLAYQSRVIIAYLSLLLIIAVPIVLVAIRNGKQPKKGAESEPLMSNSENNSSTVKMYTEAFFSGYKEKRRWFSAAYFVVRIAVNFVYIIVEPGGFVLMVQQLVFVLMIVIIIIAQPYEETFLNYWDVFVFTCLIVLGTSSQYILYASHLDYQRFWVQTFFCMQIILLCIVPIIWIIFWIWLRRNKKITLTVASEIVSMQ